MKVDQLLEKLFKGIIFIIVCVSLVSAHLTERCREALRVSVEVGERRGTVLLKFVCALLLWS